MESLQIQDLFQFIQYRKSYYRSSIGKWLSAHLHVQYSTWMLQVPDLWMQQRSSRPMPGSPSQAQDLRQRQLPFTARNYFRILCQIYLLRHAFTATNSQIVNRVWSFITFISPQEYSRIRTNNDMISKFHITAN